MEDQPFDLGCHLWCFSSVTLVQWMWLIARWTPDLDWAISLSPRNWDWRLQSTNQFFLVLSIKDMYLLELCSCSLLKTTQRCRKIRPGEREEYRSTEKIREQWPCGLSEWKTEDWLSDDSRSWYQPLRDLQHLGPWIFWDTPRSWQ